MIIKSKSKQVLCIKTAEEAYKLKLVGTIL